MCYENGYVAFIDILGFSNLIKDTVNKNSGRSAESVFYTLDRIVEKVKNTNDKLGDDGVCAYFSDSLVICHKKSIKELFRYIEEFEKILNGEIGYLYRGAIVYGGYKAFGNSILGPAIIEAHNIEENNAQYARIVIDRDALAQSEELVEDSIYLIDDIDDCLCMNPYVSACGYYENNKIDEFSDSLKQIRKDIMDDIERELKSKTISKYIWRIWAYNLFIRTVVFNHGIIDYSKLHIDLVEYWVGDYDKY